jgi:hypothetical protein
LQFLLVEIYIFISINQYCVPTTIQFEDRLRKSDETIVFAVF